MNERATCNAPGPDGLRCEHPRAVHAFPHWHGFGPEAWVLWRQDSAEPTYGGRVFEMLAALGTALAEIGAACRGAP